MASDIRAVVEEITDHLPDLVNNQDIPCAVVPVKLLRRIQAVLIGSSLSQSEFAVEVAKICNEMYAFSEKCYAARIKNDYGVFADKLSALLPPRTGAVDAPETTRIR